MFFLPFYRKKMPGSPAQISEYFRPPQPKFHAPVAGPAAGG
jgi:hypothetical protein